MHYLVEWLSAFAFTQLVECPVYLLAQRTSSRRLPGRLGVAFGASLLSHPTVWFIIPPACYAMLDPGSAVAYPLMVVVAETFAVVSEALYLGALGVAHPWRWSLAANALSAGLGFACRYAFGWP